MNSQYISLKKGKVTTDQYFLLVGLTHTQLWLVVVLKFSPIRAQEMGIHVLSKSVRGWQKLTKILKSPTLEKRTTK